MRHSTILAISAALAYPPINLSMVNVTISKHYLPNSYTYRPYGHGGHGGKSCGRGTKGAFGCSAMNRHLKRIHQHR